MCDVCGMWFCVWLMVLEVEDDVRVELEALKASSSLLRMLTFVVVWYVGWLIMVIGFMWLFFLFMDMFWVGKFGIVELNVLCSNAFAGWMLYLLCSVVACGV